ncbi:MAG: hypothetical protein ABFD50_22295 [Smithella sp.]
MAKIFVEITARHNIDGTTRPLSLKWSDGRVFEIDKVLDIRPAASIKKYGGGGGLGLRYTCWICGKQVYIWDQEGKWFIIK